MGVSVAWPRRVTLRMIGGPFNVLALAEGRDRGSTSSLVMLLGGPCYVGELMEQGRSGG